MKERDVKPDALTYQYLIRACEEEGLEKQAVAIFEDMLALGLPPDREIFHSLFKVSSQRRLNQGVH